MCIVRAQHCFGVGGKVASQANHCNNSASEGGDTLHGHLYVQIFINAQENSLQNHHRMIVCMHKKISVGFVDLEKTLPLPVSKPARSPSSAATHAFSLLSSHFTQTGFCSSPLVKNLPSSNCPPHSYIRISTLPIHLRDENSPHNKNTAHATPPPTHSQPHQQPASYTPYTCH